MKAICCTERLVSTCYTVRCHNPEDYSMKSTSMITQTPILCSVISSLQRMRRKLENCRLQSASTVYSELVLTVHQDKYVRLSCVVVSFDNIYDPSYTLKAWMSHTFILYEKKFGSFN
jgi:hypothetical protein